MLLPISALLSLLIPILGVKGGTADKPCVDACARYSVTLGYCRGAFEFNPHQTNGTYATQFVQCICEGEREDGALGPEAMLESVNMCGGCQATPGIIKDNLAQLLGLCTILSQGENPSDAEVMSFAPFGYSILTWNEFGKPNEQAPKELVSGQT